MRHIRVKKVITKKSRVLYYLGDGIWYGRIGKDKAIKGLDAGDYILEEVVDKRGLGLDISNVPMISIACH